MARIINPNFKFLVNQRKKGKRGVLLEGSSRSGKTWSSVDFLIYIASKVEHKATIHILKETYNSFKTTLFEDFDRRFPAYGMVSPSAGKKELHRFHLFGTTINLLGCDSVSKVHGSGSDYIYVNEGLDIDQDVFDQYEMRCRKFWWMDYNPSKTKCWVFDSLEKRADVSMLRTTFLDNPYITNEEKLKILGFEPWHPEDRHIDDTTKRRPHPVNVPQGTANEYKWNVYGLGLRSAPEGLVFQYVNWIKEFPYHCERVFYGLDFGYTNDPTALVKVGVDGRNMYIEPLHYESTPSPAMVSALLNRHVPNGHVICDFDPGMISKLRRMKHKIYPASKPKGSIEFGIDLIKDYKIHLVDCPPMREEQENYVWAKINGIAQNTPIDKFNHIWDAVRYACMQNLIRMNN